MQSKKCSICLEHLDLSSFYKLGKNSEKLRDKCKKCYNDISKSNFANMSEEKKQEIYKKNKEKRKNNPRPSSEKKLKYMKIYSQTIDGKFTEYKRSAKRDKRSFNITKDEFSLFWEKPCEYCGDSIPTIGIDRIDSSLGYEPGNICSCCVKCNIMKNDMNLEEFKTQVIKIYFITCF